MLHISWTEQGCIFNSDGIDYGDGVCVLTCTPDNALRPDTVVAQNFTVLQDDKQINVLETVYYPYENTLKLILDEEIANEKVMYSSTGVMDVYGISLNMTGTAYSYIEEKAETDALSITGINYLRDGEGVSNLINSINADIRLVITNSSNDAYEGVCVKMTDSEGNLIAKEEFDIGEYSNKEIWLKVRGYLFKDNNFNFSIE